jgi:hypothetical protein
MWFVTPFDLLHHTSVGRNVTIVCGLACPSMPVLCVPGRVEVVQPGEGAAWAGHIH